MINLRELSGKCTSRTFLLPEALGGLRLKLDEERHVNWLLYLVPKKIQLKVL